MPLVFRNRLDPFYDQPPLSFTPDVAALAFTGRTATLAYGPAVTRAPGVAALAFTGRAPALSIGGGSGAFWPASFNDAVFTGMTETTVKYDVPSNGTVSHRSTIESSGDPTADFTSPGGTLSYCRIRSRECVRHSDSTNEYRIEWCYLEAEGIGDDHADVIQAFAGVGDPGGNGLGTLTIANTFLRVGGSATGCLFSADGFAGNYFLDHVCFDAMANTTEGGRGMHIPIDGGGNVSMRHVYFVRTPGFPLFTVAIDRPILLWEDVYDCDLDGNGMPINLTAIPEP